MRKFLHIKTILILMGVALLVFSSIFLIKCRGGGKVETSSGGIKIGAVLPLTGSVSIFGEWIKNGLDLGLLDIELKNPELKGKIKIVYEDSQSDPKSGIAAFNKLVNVDKVDVVITAMSNVSIPLIAMADKAGIPLIMQDVTYPNITNTSKFVYRHFIQSDREASIMAKFAFDQGIKSIGILYVNDEAGLGAKKSFENIYSSLNGKVIGTESYASTDSDMKAQITKIISANPDGIYLFGNGPSWAIAIRQTKELNYHGTIFTNTAMYIPKFRELAGVTASDGVYFTYPYIDTAAQSSQNFSQIYSSKYSANPSIESAYAWDIIHIIAEAAKSKGRSFYDKMLLVKSYEGAFGKINIPENRDITTKIAVGVIKDSKISLIKVMDGNGK